MEGFDGSAVLPYLTFYKLMTQGMSDYLLKPRYFPGYFGPNFLRGAPPRTPDRELGSADVSESPDRRVSLLPDYSEIVSGRKKARFKRNLGRRTHRAALLIIICACFPRFAAS